MLHADHTNEYRNVHQASRVPVQTSNEIENELDVLCFFFDGLSNKEHSSGESVIDNLLFSSTFQ